MWSSVSPWDIYNGNCQELTELQYTFTVQAVWWKEHRKNKANFRVLTMLWTIRTSTLRTPPVHIWSLLLTVPGPSASLTWWQSLTTVPILLRYLYACLNYRKHYQLVVRLYKTSAIYIFTENYLCIFSEYNILFWLYWYMKEVFIKSF